MKRKLLSLSLAAVLALSLTACGGGNDAETADLQEIATRDVLHNRYPFQFSVRISPTAARAAGASRRWRQFGACARAVPMS